MRYPMTPTHYVRPYVRPHVRHEVRPVARRNTTVGPPIDLTVDKSFFEFVTKKHPWCLRRRHSEKGKELFSIGYIDYISGDASAEGTSPGKTTQLLET